MKELEQLEKEYQDLWRKIQELKDSLNKHKDFEVGKPYVRKELGNIVWKPESGKSAYGFGNMGPWLTQYNFVDEDFEREATEQEVKDALIKEAERIGYKQGVDIKHLLFERVGFLDDGFTGFKDNCFTEFWYKGSCVMRDGQWATIIKDETIKIGGYEVKFCNDNTHTSINDIIFSRGFWENAKSVSQHSAGCIVIFIERNYCSISLETINKILDRLK